MNTPQELLDLLQPGYEPVELSEGAMYRYGKDTKDFVDPKGIQGYRSTEKIESYMNIGVSWSELFRKYCGLQHLPGDSVICDLGSGFGELGQILYRNRYAPKYIAIDGGYIDKMMKLGWGNCRVLPVQVDLGLGKIPLVDNCVDALVFEEVYEHLPEGVYMMEEIARVLKDNGVLLFSTPFCLKDNPIVPENHVCRNRQDLPNGHIWLRTREECMDEMKKSFNIKLDQGRWPVTTIRQLDSKFKGNPLYDSMRAALPNSIVKAACSYGLSPEEAETTFVVAERIPRTTPQDTI